MPIAYLAFGSNLGDRLGQMREALVLLELEYAVKVNCCSPVYQNRAVGMGAANDFLNAVVEVETDLEPELLLDACLAVENRLGRTRSGEWAPRTIDLDILLYDDLEMETERLNLPHPRIPERDFVAKPLLDIAPNLVVFSRSIAEIVDALPSIDLKLQEEALRLIC